MQLPGRFQTVIQNYSSLQEALWTLPKQLGTVITQDVTVENVADRIVIPSGADITLDLNGNTITSALPGSGAINSFLVEVQSDGNLNLVDKSVGSGGFTHKTKETNSHFLINSGCLDMANIHVDNFHGGIHDGSCYSALVGRYMGL